MGQRLAKIAASQRLTRVFEISLFSLCNERSATGACAGTNINHMIGKPNGVFIMLDNDQCVALFL